MATRMRQAQRNRVGRGVVWLLVLFSAWRWCGTATACGSPLTWHDKVATALQQLWKAPHGATSHQPVDVLVATTVCDDACRQTLHDAGLHIRSAIETPHRANNMRMIFTGSLQLRALPAVAQLSDVVSVEGAARLTPKLTRTRVGK